MRWLWACLLGVLPASAEAFVWPSAQAEVARALEGGDAATRKSAALRIGRLDEKTASPLLAKALADVDLEVRLVAAKAAAKVHSAAAADTILPWLSSPEVRLRLAACELLRRVPSTRAIAPLGRVLGDPDAGVRLAAAVALGATGTREAVGPLLGHLDDPAPAVRAEVAWALARLGDPSAAVPLSGKIGDPALEVRRAVAGALGELGDARVAGALVLALGDGSREVRLDALNALGRLAAADAVTAIAPLAADRASPEVRSAALAALGKIGTEQAIGVLIENLATDEPSGSSPAAREALIAAGDKAIAPLFAVLERYGAGGAGGAASAAALVLASMKARAAGPAIVRAFERGSIGEASGLAALGELGDRSVIPAVLVRLSSREGATRRRAADAAARLLDPAEHDGRAVEPLVAALGEATRPDEKAAITRALGRTGSTRALRELGDLASSRDPSLRAAALDALGDLGPLGQDAVLLGALDDEQAAVRMRAALALSRTAAVTSVPALLERMTTTAADDRIAVGVALSGSMSRGGDAAALLAFPTLVGAGGGARDALIEGLGRTGGREAVRLFTELLSRTPDSADRRKIAEALAGRDEGASQLSALLADADAAVRTEAAWSSGSLEGPTALRALLPLVRERMHDDDPAVAANATASVARLAARLARAENGDAGAATGALCAALGDGRAYVRANALAGLAMARARCGDGSIERRLLGEDGAELVRASAARLLSGAPGQSGGRPAGEDARALGRCAASDKSGRVAGACRRRTFPPSGSISSIIFVVPDGRIAPLASAPYSLLRSDGLIRSGLTDRRGAVFERAAPRGDLELVVPAALVP